MLLTVEPCLVKCGMRGVAMLGPQQQGGQFHHKWMNLQIKLTSLGDCKCEFGVVLGVVKMKSWIWSSDAIGYRVYFRRGLGGAFAHLEISPPPLFRPIPSSWGTICNVCKEFLSLRNISQT